MKESFGYVGKISYLWLLFCFFNRNGMKKTFFLFFAALVSLSAFSQDTLKVMTYNIRNGNGMDKVRSYERIADVILKQDPDVVAIQELDSMTKRSNQTYVLGEVAKLTRMHDYYGPAINYSGGKYGVGILSKKQPLKVSQHPLPGRGEKRTFLMAEFEDYIFCCTHLALTEEDRMLSLNIIDSIAACQTKPFIIAGDMNAEPGSDFVNHLQKNYHIFNNLKQATWPAPEPKQTIDYIAMWKPTSTGFANVATWVVDEPVASDHRPIMSKIRVAKKSEEIFACKPYLQNPVGGGITVMWETTVPAYSWVEYGTDKENLTSVRPMLDGQAICNNDLHKIRIEGLQPGQKYYYRVCSTEMLVYKAYSKSFGHTAVSEFGTFELPEADEDEFTALVFNDLHQRTNTFQALMEQVKEVDYDFVFFNGDCIDDPANRTQASRFIKYVTEALKGDQVPTFFMRGNHEIRNAYSIGLRDHFDYVGGKTYGAFNWGDTRIVMLDCGEDKPDDTPVYYDMNDFSQLRKDQVTFLKQEMASKAFKKAEKRVLIHHIPLYGYERNLCNDLWRPVLEKAPFDISLNAHLHKYAYHPKGSQKCAYPVIVGGGNSLKDATVIILEKKKNELKIKVLNAQGETLLDI